MLVAERAAELAEHALEPRFAAQDRRAPTLGTSSSRIDSPAVLDAQVANVHQLAFGPADHARELHGQVVVRCVIM